MKKFVGIACLAFVVTAQVNAGRVISTSYPQTVNPPPVFANQNLYSVDPETGFMQFLAEIEIYDALDPKDAGAPWNYRDAQDHIEIAYIGSSPVGSGVTLAATNDKKAFFYALNANTGKFDRIYQITGKYVGLASDPGIGALYGTQTGTGDIYRFSGNIGDISPDRYVELAEYVVVPSEDKVVDEAAVFGPMVASGAINSLPHLTDNEILPGDATTMYSVDSNNRLLWKITLGTPGDGTDATATILADFDNTGAVNAFGLARVQNAAGNTVLAYQFRQPAPGGYGTIDPVTGNFLTETAGTYVVGAADLASIPEPSTILLGIAGLALVGLRRFRRK